jgi:hypothetical protein
MIAAPRSVRGRSRWPWLSALAAFSCLCSVSSSSLGEEAPVPVSLQVDLMLKVAGYDKNLAQRAAGRVRLVVLVKSHDADSARAAAQALLAVAKSDSIGSLPLEGTSVTYTDATSLAKLAGDGSIDILYMTPGFIEAEVAAIAASLDGVSVLSVGALAKYVSQGMVLGFDLAGGKPKLLVHLGQAQKQKVELSSSVLKLMRVIE